ncbi:hypothetical protein C2845_PM02G20560 [Panicum miliaceum]|uniref:Uncharacterized protein n=1 Tax=Panicum miliaceum TaxID=4540 RepID=A0A3L6S6N1_PANMI|nr:hypothetical protein C2845_PM02G20560 [Panicum miliaceum]
MPTRLIWVGRSSIQHGKLRFGEEEHRFNEGLIGAQRCEAGGDECRLSDGTCCRRRPRSLATQQPRPRTPASALDLLLCRLGLDLLPRSRHAQGAGLGLVLLPYSRRARGRRPRPQAPPVA